MDFSQIFMVMAATIAMTFFLGRFRALKLGQTVGGRKSLNSLPTYYGSLMAMWCGIPCLILFALWMMFDDVIISQAIMQELPQAVLELPASERGLIFNMVSNIAENGATAGSEPYMISAADRLQSLRETSQLTLIACLASMFLLILATVWARMSAQTRARTHVEGGFKWVLLICASIAIFTTAGIVFSVLFESIRFFQSVPITEFLFGLEWSPQMAIRSDQVGGSGAFGAVPLFAGTLLISLIAMVIAVPAGLMAAIYLSEYARPAVRSTVKPLLEVLAGIPTVVYGFFAALTVAPFIRDTGGLIGLSVSSESALAAGLVMGIMIIPFVSSLSDDVINAVPQSLRDGAYGLGATRSETIKQVVIPAALPGIVGGILLAVSRAIGETMIVVMAAGLAANLTANPLESVTTVTVQIVTLLVGDQEFNSPKTLSAFALGLMLFTITLVLNYIALLVVKKYREQYE
ncbi:phosphate ABC transporter permease subunit PstC [Alteromonas sp. ASW11-130]|uniref:phosphate ABC transporter permease subunit PstC n=1 Tax=Alteromonas sp. ASW11-130 TaxID=3015775 RepID=UPI002242A49F|nr:phosphate ABC transporter permease subunit PstC [Alteromonas sp. ASW11-130]MCW8092750.1 phosphate ABC transporter permease subunit PstC [Alteromonas sp. ASW11-130]